MSNEIVSLSDLENFTAVSGLVQRLDEKGWDKIWKPLTGRPKSTVFVFDVVNNRMLYELGPRDKVSIKSRLLDPPQGIKYKAFAVSDQSRTFRFQTEFVCGDTKVPRAVLEIRIHVTQPDDLAISFVEGRDPVKDLCNSVKSYLDVAFKEVYLEDIDSLQHFVDRIHDTMERVKIEHLYLILESTAIQLELPRTIEDAFATIQQERTRRKTVAEVKGREYVEAEQQHRVDKLKRQSQFEIDELELARLGITDPKTRLLMRDPQKRAQYLDQIYQQQMALIEQGKAQDKELLKIRLDTIEKFRDKALSEYSGIDELRQLLNLISQTTGISPGESILGTVATEVERIVPQLEGGAESIKVLPQTDVSKPSKSTKTENASAGKDKPPEEGEARSEGESVGTEAPSASSKPRRRRRQSSSRDLGESGELRGNNIEEEE